jgi:transcriptional regulator with XRE-family HTH domain
VSVFYRSISTKQSAIARLESEEANPTITFLEKIASAMGYELSIKKPVKNW